MQKYTYHSHTSALNKYDGRNSAIEMISRAEELGFEAIGISNHMCYHPNIAHSNPMNISDIGEAIDTYLQIIEEIRQASRYSKIKVYAGFEVDFFPSVRWRNDFEKIISTINADYYIGSSHVIRTQDESIIINPYDVLLHGKPCPKNFIEDNYHHCWDNLIESIKSGYFKFICHLDLHKIFKLGIEPTWDKQKWQVIDTLSLYNQPYELNTSGWNKANEQHPQDWVLKELANRNVPIIISDDAHSVNMIGQHFECAEQLLASLNYTNRLVSICK